MSVLARALTSVTLAATLLTAGPAQAQETRAALDPALVEGRGATVNFAEQEAENAVHTGELLSASAAGDIASYRPDRRGTEQRAAYTLPAEASGRDAVRLDPGEYVEFTLTRDANAITVRYSIPDIPGAEGSSRRSR
jgi:alpha-1,3-glucanase-like protein